MYGLSKTKYCRGKQCTKIVWLDDHAPELAENTFSETIAANGTAVGELARAYFGSYDLVPYDRNKQTMCDATAAFMLAGADNIAEASFVYNDLYCAVDILHRNDDGWDIVEVKSSTTSDDIKDVYIDDMTFQYYVLTNCGLKIKKVYLMRLNNTYERCGALDLKKLFRLDDCTDVVVDRSRKVPQTVAAIRKAAVSATEPVQQPGLQCQTPYDCPYRSHCMPNLPDHSVFNIARLEAYKKYILYNQGIVSYADLFAIVQKEPKLLNDKQRRQVENWCTNAPDAVNRVKLQVFLAQLQYPIYHLDFETYQQAIPEFDGCRPYEQIPFQYSLHIEYADGHLEHKEFLAKEGTDPRRALAESLVKDIPADAFAMAYNMSFEQSRLARLAYWFPDLADHLLAIRDNMHDLMEPFQAGAYYSAAMHGSYSIKYVLPALWPNDPELDYHNLDEVHKGDEASAAFASMASLPPEKVASLRANLLKYCGLDTYAMVKILRKLREAVK